ncbi:type II toxin-antitoxin system VapC family toxin [Salsipaludibacter albus]|uniref:type II toxin-antitoxin system VapC family toxin n=1 Tax=Salsipaludibacter albus TaxID=2849650 RepID=UPI0023689714|nr:type II toxin-antitoxin system VapC family toxin [Salsipaludibacter albus]MBY5162073.1 type II toxin-antitoxin system VapC family toxin [Salsipaludibacter albus]
MTVVADASIVVAALVDSGSAGQWAADVVAAEPLVAPHLLPVEAANILRRAERHGQLSPDTASLAHADLVELAMDLLPFEPFAERAWELRANVTSYDAWYVAIAEQLDVPLATLDLRLVGAPGTTCQFLSAPVP